MCTLLSAWLEGVHTVHMCMQIRGVIALLEQSACVTGNHIELVIRKHHGAYVPELKLFKRSIARNVHFCTAPWTF